MSISRVVVQSRSRVVEAISSLTMQGDCHTPLCFVRNDMHARFFRAPYTLTLTPAR